MAKKKTPEPERRFVPFVGWKGLVARPDGRLSSPSREAEWPPRKPLVAECDRDPHSAFARCSCGIYATKSFEDLKKNSYNWNDTSIPWLPAWTSPTEELVWVVAEVKLWGEIRRGTIGYRAQYAYPKTVYVPGHKWELGRRICDLYGCRLRFIDRFTGEVI
jgi:hypothetical protein